MGSQIPADAGLTLALPPRYSFPLSSMASDLSLYMWWAVNFSESFRCASRLAFQKAHSSWYLLSKFSSQIFVGLNGRCVAFSSGIDMSAFDGGWVQGSVC